MGTTGIVLQYGQATGIFANPTSIEANGPLAFDNITTFKNGYRSYNGTTIASSLDNTRLLSCSGLSLTGGFASYTSDGSTLTAALSPSGGIFCSQVVAPLIYVSNSLNVGATASPTQIISSAGAIASPHVTANSFNINNLASIDNTWGDIRINTIFN